jgi:hypothetical protein
MVSRRNVSFGLAEVELGAAWQQAAVLENFLCGALLSSFATAAG